MFVFLGHIDFHFIPLILLVLSGDDGTTAYESQTQCFPSYETLTVFELNI